MVAVGSGLGVGLIVGTAVEARVGVIIETAVTRTTQGVAVGSDACESLTLILVSTVASMSALEQAASVMSTINASDIEDR